MIEKVRSMSLRASFDRIHYEMNKGEKIIGDLSIDPEAREWYDAYNGSRELEIIKEMAEEAQE